MKIVADSANGCEYLTAGKKYAVLQEHPRSNVNPDQRMFDILCDKGTRAHVLLKDCPHIQSDWRIVEYEVNELEITEEEEEEWKRMEKKLTGGSVDYYKAHVENPTSGGDPYTLEVNDFIEAFKLNFAEGNIVKAIARLAQLRQEAGKPGSFAQYEAEKQKFFAERIYIQNVEETK